MQNHFKLTVDSRSINEAFCRAVVAAFMMPLDPTIEELSDVKTAVSEAVTNAIVHGYGDAGGVITVEGSIKDNGMVTVKISDKGVGIPDVARAMEPLYTTGGSDRAGLGFTVMQSFCDRMKVTSKEGKGTSVLLTKRIAGRRQW